MKESKFFSSPIGIGPGLVRADATSVTNLFEMS